MSGGSSTVVSSGSSVDSKSAHHPSSPSQLVLQLLQAHKGYLPSSSPSYVVSSFLKHIQPRSLRGSAKEYVTAFAKYFFSRRPQLSPSDIRALLLGDDDRKGLLESCGNVKGLSAALSAAGGGELRSSAVLCVELLLMLLDSTVNSQSADHFLDALVAAHSAGQLSGRLLASMRLSQHIERAVAAGSTTQLEYVYKLLFILESAIPALKGKEWLGSAEAVNKYEQWQRARLAEIEEQQRRVPEVEDEDRVLSSWADVKLADLEAEEGQAEAALAELIADVDAEAEAEGGQKDPLGILQKPIASSTASGKSKQSTAAAAGSPTDIRTPARLGVAAAAQMKALWQQVSSSGPQQKLDKAQQQEGKGAGGVDGGSELLRDVLSAAHLSSGGGSISADSYEFSPTLFLAQVHAHTSLEQLQRGVSHLQRSVNNRAAALKALVADHYGQYVFCLDTIQHLEQLMAAEVSDKGSSRAQRIRQQLDQLNQQCTAAYDSIIQRKAGGERMRQTLSTMTQYRFLFALPGEVAQYAATRHFAQVVRAYKKAKGISISTPLQADDGRRDIHSSKLDRAAVQQQQQQPAGDLSSLVLAEVFRVISGVRTTLFRQLETAGLPLDDQANAIAYLHDLDADIDPAWYFLHRQTANTNQQMTQATLALIDACHTQRTQRQSSPQQLSQDGLGSSQQQKQPQLPTAHLSLTAHPRQSSVVDGPSVSPVSFPSLSAQLSSLPWNRFGSALLVNPIFLSSLPSPSTDAAEWAPLLPASIQLSTAVDEEAAALLPSLIHRLCEIVSVGVPNLLTLARLAATAQSTLSIPSAAMPAPLSVSAQSSLAALASSSAASHGPAGSSSVASLLSAMDDSSRRGVESLLHSVLHHFAAHVRLALFPLNAHTARRWLSGRTDSLSAPATPTPSTRQPSTEPASPTAGFSLPSPAATRPSATQLTQQPAIALPTSIDKSSEHQPFSMDSMQPAGTALPLIQPAETDNRLPVPSCLASIVRRLLQLHSQLTDSQLPSSILAPFTELRKDLMRSYAQQYVRNVQADVRAVTEHEDWQLSSHHTMQQQTRKPHSAVTRRERRGSNPSSAAGPSAAADTAGAAIADCSSLRITSLPGHFSALFLSAVDRLTAIPSFKPVWLIKLVAGPMMDAMRAFATAEQALASRCAQQQQQQADGPANDEESVPVALRLLLVLANVRYTRLQLLPSLLASLLALFPHSTHSLLRAAYQQSVLPAYEEAETAALHHFIRLQLAHIHQHIAQRAYSRLALTEHVNSTQRTQSSIRTARTVPALRTRGCVVATCLHLVAVHAQLFLVCGHAADEVTQRAMQALLTGTLHSIHIALQQRQDEENEEAEKGGGAGLPFWSAHSELLLPLVRLELSFIHTVLASFSTEASTAAKQQVESLLRAAAAPVADEEQQQAAIARQLKVDVGRSHLMFAAFAASASHPQPAQHNGHKNRTANAETNSTRHSQQQRGKERGAGERQGGTDEDDDEDEEADEVVEDEEEDGLTLPRR